MFNSLQSPLSLLGRLLVALLFVPAGFSKISVFTGTVGYIASKGVPLPELAAAARHHPEVQFVGLAMSSSNSELARHLIKEAGVDYPNVMVSPAVEAAWRVSSFPSSILLDEEGHVVWRRAGMVDHADIERALRELPGR